MKLAVAYLGLALSCLLALSVTTWGASPTQLGTVGNYHPASLTQSGTSCTISATTTGCSDLPTGDCGTTIDFTSSSPITVTLPNNITIIGCSVTMSQTGTGQITLIAASGAMLSSSHGFTGTYAQYSVIGVRIYQNSGGTAARYEFFGDGKLTCPTTYYISAAGNDSAAGTSPATSWATITKVNEFSFPTNSCLRFNGGDNFSGNLVVAGTNILVGSYGTGSATLTSGSGGANSATVLLNGLTNFTFAGLIVRSGVIGSGGTQIGVWGNNSNGTITGVDSRGFVITDTGNSSAGIALTGTSAVTASSNTLGGLGGAGSQDDVGIADNATGNTVLSGNTITNIGGRATAPAGNSGFGIIGSNGTNATSTLAVTGNRITMGGQNIVSNNGGAGIEIANANNFTVSYNEVSLWTTNFGSGGGDGDGIDIDTGARNGLVLINYTHGNYGYGYLFLTGTTGSGWGPVTARYNISENDAIGYPNSAGGSFLIAAGGATGVVLTLTNNTIYQSNVPGGGNYYSAFNFLGAGSPATGTIENNIARMAAGNAFASCFNSGGGNLPLTGTTFRANGWSLLSGSAFKFGPGCASAPGGGYTTLAAWQGGVTGGDAGATTANPLLAGSPPAGGCTWTPGSQPGPQPCPAQYQLTYSSTYIGAGVTTSGSTDYYGDPVPNGVGSGYNIGADGAAR